MSDAALVLDLNTLLSKVPRPHVGSGLGAWFRTRDNFVAVSQEKLSVRFYPAEFIRSLQFCRSCRSKKGITAVVVDPRRGLNV